MSATVDLLYSDIEEQLRGSVRSLLEDRSDPADVLVRCESDEPYDVSLWRALAADMGVAGLPVPEERGGAGASFRETAVVAEELGRCVAPVPFLGSAVLATQALLRCGDDELLAGVAAGDVTAALAVPLSTPPAAPFTPSVRSAAEGLDGTVTSVADALVADVLILPVQDDGGVSLLAVDATDVVRQPAVSMDLTRPVCDITFDGSAGRRLASGDGALDALGAALTAGAAILASEQLGLAERCLEMTVAHTAARYQFGRPVGSFQGLKHRLADVWVAITQARAAARYAAVCLAESDPDLDVATAVAQAHCSAVAVRAAEECIQMHGGIGFTWEHPAHLFLKRAKTSAIALGTADQHRARLAALVDLPL